MHLYINIYRYIHTTWLKTIKGLSGTRSIPGIKNSIGILIIQTLNFVRINLANRFEMMAGL